MPVFSIVVPAYNAASTLRETMDAVLAQEYRDWELIVVDDGSTDATRAIAAEYATRDERVRVLSQNNTGSGGAYNSGVAAAKGDFVTICSADDVLLPEHLREMNALIGSSPDCDIFSSNGYFWYEDGSRKPVYAAGRWTLEHSRNLEAVITGCFYSVGATYRRGLFDLVGGYRTDIYGEDYDFWLRAMARGAAHRYTPLPLSLHRISATQKSADLCRVYRSDIRTITDLSESGLLSGPELARAGMSVDRLRERIRLLGTTPEDRTANEIERQSQALSAFLKRTIGPRRSRSALAALRRASPLLRPIRAFAARVTAAIRWATRGR